MTKLIISFAFFYLILLIGVYFFQKNLLFFPDQTSMDDCPEVTSSGGSIYRSEDGLVRLYDIRSNHLEPKGWIIHFHGNAGRACDRFNFNKHFLSLGYHLILAEYPGYSEVRALPSEDEILKTAEASYRYINDINKNNLPIILYGESLGTGPATYLASLNLKNTSALILQTPYPSLASVGQSHYFYLPVGLLLRHQFKAKNWAKSVDVPVFIFHGNQDEVIHFSLGQKQARNFSQEQVTFWEVQGAHHNDLLLKSGEKLWRKINIFLNDVSK